MLEGVSAAFSGALGFVAALLAGIGVGFAGHGVRWEDTHDGFFLLYLFLIFPLGLLRHLLEWSGGMTVLAMISLTGVFFTSERFKPECLLGLCLSLGLYVFQAIGLTAKAGIADQEWLRLGGIGLGVVAIVVAGKTLVAYRRR